MSGVRKQYPFDAIERKWRERWLEGKTFRAWNPGESIPPEHPFAKRHGCDGPLPPKYYALDMFPYPSGAGLHVGLPEGYTARDFVSRFHGARGLTVLHPMGGAPRTGREPV